MIEQIIKLTRILWPGIIFIVIIKISLISCVGRQPPAPVTINKCCRVGEYLNSKKVCVVGSTIKWAPLIFLMGRNSYFEPHGEYPRFFRINENNFPKTCSNYDLFTGSNNIVLFSNGSLHIYEKSTFVHPDNYCADKESALVCLPKINGVDSLIAPKKLAKVKKCCGKNSAYNKDDRTCTILSGLNHPLHEVNFVNSSNFEISYGFPDCSDYAIAGIFKNEYLDDESGNLTLESGKMFQTNDFCLEHTIGQDIDINSKDLILVSMFACSDHFSKPHEPTTYSNNQDSVRNVVISVGLLISVIFLSATLATGYLMPSNHHVLHWRCQVYYVSCLLVGDLLLAITQISGSSIKGPACVSIAIIMHFIFLAAFFWLNTMCFNIWWTFRDFRPTSLEKNQEVFRLRIYSIYAWGVPFIIALVAAILDLIPHEPNDSYLRPRFGERICWFYGDMEILTYFFGPIGILLCINLLLFASTARQLTCGLWKLDDVKSTTERAALGRVCLKLVIVMGITWVADIISWLVGGLVRGNLIDYIWYVDLINALQGVFIFIVVGCQPQVWLAIKKIWTTKTGRNITTNTQGPQHSSSSHGLPSIGETVTHNTITNTTNTKVPMETVC